MFVLSRGTWTCKHAHTLRCAVCQQHVDCFADACFYFPRKLEHVITHTFACTCGHLFQMLWVPSLLLCGGGTFKPVTVAVHSESGAWPPKPPAIRLKCWESLSLSHSIIFRAYSRSEKREKPSSLLPLSKQNPRKTNPLNPAWQEYNPPYYSKSWISRSNLMPSTSWHHSRNVRLHPSYLAVVAMSCAASRRLSSDRNGRQTERKTER